MIISFIILGIITFLTTIFSFVPSITELPFGVDAFLVTAMGYFNRIVDVFPPLHTLLVATLIYLSYQFLKVIIKFFFGSHSPFNAM